MKEKDKLSKENLRVMQLQEMNQEQGGVMWPVVKSYCYHSQSL